MERIAKSLMSVGWATTLLGVEEFTRVFSGLPRGTDTEVSELDSAVTAIRPQFSDRFDQAYELGDKAQRGVVDLLRAGITLDSTNVVGSALDVAEPVVQGVGLLTCSSDWLLAWQEFRNKIDIYNLVKDVDRRLNVSQEEPLSVLVARAYLLGDFHALWAVEGLGRVYGNWALERGANPRYLLVTPESLGLPEKSLTMLNAGIGLAFAEHLLADVGDSSEDQLVGLVRQFIELCEANATPGYEGAALESLGLVTRTFHKELTLTVGAIVEEIGSQVAGFFWHGVGRAIYFSPRYMIPFSTINWADIADFAPNENAGRNVISGLAWAVTLVNMQQPQIMARLLRGQGHVVSANDAFANGVASSTIMRYAISPNTEFQREFCRYRPNTQSSEFIAQWDDQVRTPCFNAIERDYPVLVRKHLLGEIFRYHPLAEFPNLEGQQGRREVTHSRTSVVAV